MSDQDSHTVPEPIESAARSTRKSSAIVRASGHSPFSSLMMIMLPLIFVGTIGYFLFEAGVFEEGDEPINKPAPTKLSVKAPVGTRGAKVKLPGKNLPTRTTKTAVSPAQNVKPSEKIKMVAPKITRFDKKSRTYIIEADTAVRDKSRPDILNLKNVKSEIRLPRRQDKVFIVADTGVFNRKSDEMDLKGNIKVRSTNGYRATLSTAYLWLKQGRILSKNPVIVYMPEGTITANGVEILDGGTRILFLNRARMDLKGKDK